MGFFDLNVPYLESSSSNTAATSAQKAARIKIVVKAMELGYTGIAYNRTMKGVMSERDRCSIPLLTLSPLLKVAPSLSSSVNFHRDLLGIPRSSPFRQYTRLTVSVDSIQQCQALNSGNPILKTYDIVAARPLNQTAFDYTCEKAEIDIISVDFSDKTPFRLKQPMVKAAVERGVYFEITYSDLILDVQARRQMISNAKMLVDWTRGKDLIFSSAAPSVCELRGPNDVANLGFLLGVFNERARAAVSKNCRTLIANALKRKHFFKEAIRIELISSNGKCDSGKPLSLDWLKWDPISSGDGDLILDDMETSTSAPSKESKTVKAIDFTSAIDNLPSCGFELKNLLPGTKPSDTPVRADAVSEKLENETTKYAPETEEVRKVTVEEVPRNSHVSDAGSALFGVEQQDLQLKKCISIQELKERSQSENVAFLASSCELNAVANADIVLDKAGVVNLTEDVHMEDAEYISLDVDNLPLHENTLGRKLAQGPGDEAEKVEQVSSLIKHEGQKEVIMEEQKPGEPVTVAETDAADPNKPNEVPLNENIVEKVASTVDEAVALISCMKPKDEPSTADNQAQEEEATKKQELGDSTKVTKVKSRARQRASHPLPFSPLNRVLHQASFKRKARKSKR